MRYITFILLASLLSGCPNDEPAVTTDATASDVGASETVCEAMWVEAFAGRFYMEPKSVWIQSGLTPVKYQQVHWWLEIEALSGDASVCDLHPRSRKEGAGTCLGDQVGAVKVLQSTRTMILKEMVQLGLLPTEGLNISVFPNELFDEREFARMVGLNTSKHFGDDNIEFCRVKLTIQMKRSESAPPSDGQWWDEQVYIFPEDAGECCD